MALLPVQANELERSTSRSLSLSPLACWPSIAASCSSFPPLSLCRSQSSASLRRSNLLVVSSQQPLVHCCCATGDRNGARRWGSSASFIPSPLPFASLNLLALQVDGTWWSSSARKDEASSGANKSNCPTVIRLKRIVRSLSLSLSHSLELFASPFYLIWTGYSWGNNSTSSTNLQAERAHFKPPTSSTKATPARKRFHNPALVVVRTWDNNTGNNNSQVAR